MVKIGAIAIPLLLSASGALAVGIFIAVPNAALDEEGNTNAGPPFFQLPTSTGRRYQQVFAAAQFGRLPPGGAFILALAFRSDCSHFLGGASLSNLQVNLSTSARNPDGLSPVFSENVGPDDLVVYGPGPYAVSSGFGGCPSSLSRSIELETLFFYNPAKGNLLLDVRMGPGYEEIPPADFLFDAVDCFGDPTSRVYADSVAATSAQFADTTGIIMAFNCAPVPVLATSHSTNGMVLTWPTDPKAFVLETCEWLRPGAGWRPYSDAIEENFFFRTATIPERDLKSRQFFRLAWHADGNPPCTTK